MESYEDDFEAYEEDFEEEEEEEEEEAPPPTRCAVQQTGERFRIFGARSASASTRTAQRARSCDRWAAGPGGKSGHWRPLGSHCPPLATASRAFGGPRCGPRILAPHTPGCACSDDRGALQLRVAA